MIRWTPEERALIIKALPPTPYGGTNTDRLRKAQQVLPENRWRNINAQIAKKFLAEHETPVPVETISAPINIPAEQPVLPATGDSRNESAPPEPVQSIVARLINKLLDEPTSIVKVFNDVAKFLSNRSLDLGRQQRQDQLSVCQVS